MRNAKAGDRLDVFMERSESSIWLSSKPGCVASNSSLHHVEHLEREYS